MENSRNLGQMLHTQEHQSSPGTGRNFEQMPYTHGAQSLPDAGQNFEHMPYTHTDQTFPNANHNFEQVPHAQPNYHNFNAPADNLGLTKTIRSTAEKNQFLTQKRFRLHKHCRLKTFDRNKFL